MSAQSAAAARDAAAAKIAEIVRQVQQSLDTCTTLGLGIFGFRCGRTTVHDSVKKASRNTVLLEVWEVRRNDWPSKWQVEHGQTAPFTWHLAASIDVPDTDLAQGHSLDVSMMLGDMAMKHLNIGKLTQGAPTLGQNPHRYHPAEPHHFFAIEMVPPIGEPLLHKTPFSMLSEASDYSVRVLFYCMGVLLSGAMLPYKKQKAYTTGFFQGVNAPVGSMLITNNSSTPVYVDPRTGSVYTP